MHDSDGITNEDLVAQIAEATGVDLVRAGFMLGLHQGATSGDVVVVGGAHIDPPAVELTSTSATIIRTESGGMVAVIESAEPQSLVWSENGPLVSS